MYRGRCGAVAQHVTVNVAVVGSISIRRINQNQRIIKYFLFLARATSDLLEMSREFDTMLMGNRVF